MQSAAVSQQAQTRFLYRALFRRVYRLGRTFPQMRIGFLIVCALREDYRAAADAEADAEAAAQRRHRGDAGVNYAVHAPSMTTFLSVKLGSWADAVCKAIQANRRSAQQSPLQGLHDDLDAKEGARSTGRREVAARRKRLIHASMTPALQRIPVFKSKPGSRANCLEIERLLGFSALSSPSPSPSPAPADSRWTTERAYSHIVEATVQVHPVFRSAGTADVDDLAEGPYFYSPATPAARDRDRNRNRRAAAAAASAPPSMDDADAAHVARLRRLSNTYNFLRRAGSGCSPELEVLYNLVRVSDDVARATQSTGGKRKRAAEGVVAAMYEYERHLQQINSAAQLCLRPVRHMMGDWSQLQRNFPRWAIHMPFSPRARLDSRDDWEESQAQRAGTIGQYTELEKHMKKSMRALISKEDEDEK